ncbi:hypothetical protein DFH11DRAFT_1723141 [Phellopilus nigrolimitatus]|nr:hypothetical protein DFH11DRAFT_1723141 [Phellopilus nigrolimitatus]
MLHSLPSALKRTVQAPRNIRPQAPRMALWTPARAAQRERTSRSYEWAAVAAGAVALSGAFVLGRSSIRLDSEERLKPKPKPKPKEGKATDSAPPAEPVAHTEGFLQEKEDEANAEGAPGAEGENGQAAGGGGAYNPETGEINWDCPCLGGMAHGPCGQEFRDAFSCFVYSEDEPKGINCVEKFKGMQDCFRRHPEVYGEEIMADDEEGDAPPSAVPPEEGAETTAISAPGAAAESS